MAIIATISINILTIIYGIAFYYSTFKFRENKIDICEGTDYQNQIFMTLLLSLITVLPVCIFTVVSSIMTKNRKSFVIGIITIFLCITPYITGNHINRYILMLRASAFDHCGD